jgi:hypothetical protein
MLQNQEEIFDKTEYDNNYVFNNLPIDVFNNIIETLNKLTPLINNKNIIKKKGDLEKIDLLVKNLEKTYFLFNDISRRCLIDSYGQNKKNFMEIKKNKKLLKNKDNSHVNKKRIAQDFTLKFMNIELENNMISTADILRSFSNYIKEEKGKKNKDIFVYKEDNQIDNKSFKIIGTMKELFDNIQKEAVKRNTLLIIPEVLTYNDLFTYIKYLFKE